MIDYNKNTVVMKDKNPPIKKNGAKGMYFCLCLCAHIAPIVKVKMYPNVAAITASDKSIGKNGKKVISNIPISISGNR